MLAICLNLAWESMAIAVLPNPVWLWSILEWSWLVLDVGSSRSCGCSDAITSERPNSSVTIT